MDIGDTERQVGSWLERPNIRLGLIIVIIVLLGFVALKEGFSLWLLSKLNFTKPAATTPVTEHLSACPPGRSQNIMGMCR